MNAFRRPVFTLPARFFVTVATLLPFVPARAQVVSPPSTVGPVVPSIVVPLVPPPTSPPRIVAVPRQVQDTEEFDRIIADDRTPPETRVVNISVLARIKTYEPLHMGFVIAGTSQRTVLLRASSGGLRAFGITEPAVIPVMDVYNSTGGLIISHSGVFSPAVIRANARVGGLFDDVHQSAIVMTLPAGAYSIRVWDLTYGYTLPAMPGLILPRVDGFALAEVYDIAGGADAQLSNASTLGRVAATEGGAIVGFVLLGQVSRRLVMRGVGPGLAVFRVGETLAEPSIVLRNGNGTVLASNNGVIRGETATMAAAAGAFPLPANSRDAAFDVTLASGAYTVQLDSPRPESGLGLLELYSVP